MSAGGGRSTVNSIPIRKESNQTNGIDSTIRLSSFSVPRDLTLGGAGPLRGARGNANKKVYTPNLNVVRNKNTNVKTSKDTSFRGRNRPDRGKSERGRGRGGRGALIQTAGLFSEGVGAEHIKRSSNSSYRSSVGSGGGNEDTAIRKPTLIKREGKIDTKIEKQHIKEILGDTDDDDFDEIKTDLDKVPIKLSEERWNTPNAIKIEKLDPDDIKAKTELSANDDVISEKLNYLNFKQQIGSISRYPLSVEEVFSRTQPQLFLLQLPDTLPCQTAITAVPSTNKEGDDSDEEEFKGSSLRDLEEGQIGKLIRFKSGRQQLVLGSTRFDLGLGIDSGFLQEVMSITTNRDERSGNMVNLGPIQAKLTAVPDWESLFKDIS